MDANQRGVIFAHEVMPLLLEACPSLAPQWVNEVLEENLDDESDGGRLFYVDAGTFIHHLVPLNVDGRVAEFLAVFDVFELAHRGGR